MTMVSSGPGSLGTSATRTAAGGVARGAGVWESRRSGRARGRARVVRRGTFRTLYGYVLAVLRAASGCGLALLGYGRVYRYHDDEKHLRCSVQR